MTARRLCAVALALSVAGCAARSAATAVPRTAVPPLDALRAGLDSIFQAEEFAHASWGVKIESLRTGETLYRHDDFKLLLPASNQKLITSAVAAERLGWDYRFTTRLLANGPIDATGTLHGDLIVSSDGDPTINRRHEDRALAFERWVDALWNRGVRAINGRIIGDDNAFTEPGLGEGWTWENLSYGFGTAVGALQYNENQFVVEAAPAHPGSPPTITTAPLTHGMVILNEATTSVVGSRTTLDITRLPGSNVLRVVGEIAADATTRSITAAVQNPTQFYVNTLKAALLQRGIAVAGDATDIDDLPGGLPLAGVELLRDYSPPLSEVIDVCLKWSRNEYAETLLRAFAPRQPAAANDALEVMRSQLAAWGIGSTFVAPLDGSGLSRQDYVTAHALNLLLTYIWMEPTLADIFRSTLPVAGVSGTLADRMKETPLAGRIWAKTGTLNRARSLSGYLQTSAGEPIVFSMLANNYQVSASEIDDAMERALLRVFEFAPATLRETDRAGSPSSSRRHPRPAPRPDRR